MFTTTNYIKLLKYGRSEGHFGLKEENNIETKMHLTKEEGCLISRAYKSLFGLLCIFTTTLNNTYLVAPQVDNWGCETTTDIITSLSYINKSI